MVAFNACMFCFNNAVQEFTDKAFESSDQHKYSNESRLARDNEDEPTLRNIETGVVANEGVNVDQAKRIGNAVLELMEDQDALSFTFKKSNKAVTLGIKNTAKLAMRMFM